MACLALGFLLLSVAMNLYTYQRLGHERSIVRIVFEKTAPQRYLATLTRLDISSTVQYELLGDEWQLDARMLKWHSLANLFGLDALYRLERLSGRYHDVRDETGKPRSVYALHAQDPVDYWILMKKVVSLNPQKQQCLQHVNHVHVDHIGYLLKVDRGIFGKIVGP